MKKQLLFLMMATSGVCLGSAADKSESSKIAVSEGLDPLLLGETGKILNIAANRQILYTTVANKMDTTVLKKSLTNLFKNHAIDFPADPATLLSRTMLPGYSFNAKLNDKICRVDVFSHDKKGFMHCYDTKAHHRNQPIHGTWWRHEAIVATATGTSVVTTIAEAPSATK